MAGKPGRSGRQALPPEQRKRNNVTFRIRDSLKEALEQRAREAGRSLSEEIEFELELSSYKDELTYGIFGSKLRYRQMQLLAVAIQHIEELTGHKWTEDYETAQAVREAFESFVDMFARDKGKPVDVLRHASDKAFLGSQIFKELIESIGATTEQSNRRRAQQKRKSQKEE